MSQETKRFIIRVVRWIARVLAILVSGPFIYFLFFRSGAVLPELGWTVPNEMPLFVAWLAVIIGILISWRWEMVGGLLIAAGAVAIGVLGYLGCGPGELPTCTLIAGPYLLTGLLLLSCCWGRRQLECGDANGEQST